MANNHPKTIFITGGTSGIGLATAKKFFEEGYQVILTGSNEKKLQKVIEEYPSFQAFISDASKTEDINNLYSKVNAYTTGLNTLFVNAGIGMFKRFDEISYEDFDKLIAINYKAVFFTIQKLLPLMQIGSSIIINASWTHLRGLPTAALYASSKAAIAYLAKVLALELAPRKIRVNTISPGYTNTDQFNESHISPERYKATIAKVPIGRFAHSSEIANTVFFLASDMASYINGQELVVDGGLTAVHFDE